MASDPKEKFEEFVCYCRTILKGESAELIKLIRRRYEACNSAFLNTMDMVELLDTTTNKLQTEPQRQFVHLKDFLAELKVRGTKGGEEQNNRKRKAAEQFAPVAKKARHLDSGSDSSDIEGRKIQKAVGSVVCKKAMSKSSLSLVVMPLGDPSLCASLSGALQPVTSAQTLSQSSQITALPFVPPTFTPSTLLLSPNKTVPSSVKAKSTPSPSPQKTSLFHDASALFSSFASETATSQQPAGLGNQPTNGLSVCNSGTELVLCCASDSSITDHGKSENGTSLTDIHISSIVSAQVETEKKRDILVENADPTMLPRADVKSTIQCSPENITEPAGVTNADTLEKTLGADMDISNQNRITLLKLAVTNGGENCANSSSCTSDLKRSAHSVGSPDDQEIHLDKFAMTNATSSAEGVHSQTTSNIGIKRLKRAELTRLVAPSKDASETADVTAKALVTAGEQAATSASMDTPKSKEEAKNEKHIKRLETLLEKLRDKIENIREKEITLDEMGEEDSSYIFEDRLQKKFVKVWSRLCSLQGHTPASGRPTERRFRYQGTRFPEINRKIERFVNRRKNDNFPDFHNIHNIVKKINTQHKLGLNAQQINNISREAFLDVGETLQKRRHEDFIVNFNNRQTTMAIVEKDPALFDQELSRKLDESQRIGKSRLEEVISKYTALQMKLDTQEEEEEGDYSKSVSGQARSLGQDHKARVKDMEASNKEPGRKDSAQDVDIHSMIEMDVAEEGYCFHEDQVQAGDHATAQKTQNGVLERASNKSGSSGFDSGGPRLQPGVPDTGVVAAVCDKTPLDGQHGNHAGKPTARGPGTKDGMTGAGVKVIKQETFQGPRSGTLPVTQATVCKMPDHSETNSFQTVGNTAQANSSLCNVNKGSVPGSQSEHRLRVSIPVQQPWYGRDRPLQLNKVKACGVATTTKPSTAERHQSASARGSSLPARLHKGQSPVNVTACLKVPSSLLHTRSSRRDFLYRPGAAQSESAGKQRENITAVLEISDDEESSNKVGQNDKDYGHSMDNNGETVIVLDSDSD